MGAGLGLWSSGQASRDAGWRPGSDRAGFVYVIEGDHGYLKVGHSVSPPSRLGTLQTGSPYRLRILHTLFIDSDAAAVEASARSTLERWKVLNEWFDVSPDVAIAAVYGAAVRFGDVGQGEGERGDAASSPWIRRAGLVAAAFTPMWVAIATGHPIFAAPLMFLALVVLSAALLQARRRPPVGIMRWAGAILAGLGASILAGLLVGSLTTSASAASATELPRYDTEAYCRNVVALFNGSESAKTNCLAGETDAKAKVTRVWPQVPEPVRDRCVKTSAIAGASSNYQALSGCIVSGVGGEWLNGNLTITR